MILIHKQKWLIHLENVVNFVSVLVNFQSPIKTYKFHPFYKNKTINVHFFYYLAHENNKCTDFTVIM